MMSSSGEKPKIILTCEHAGNDVPEAYKHLFSNKEDVLYTHRGYDIGALEIAKAFEDALKTELYYTTISRLLVEANRSEDNPQLFSRFTDILDKDEKDEILSRYYTPYREKVKQSILQALEHGPVIHLSIHSFTPVLEGKVREAEVGILFDPARSFEKLVAKNMINELNSLSPSLKVVANSPYKGTDDGFTTYLRNITDQNRYAGIEIEVNQKFFTDHEEVIGKLKNVLITAVRRTALSVNSVPR